MWPGLRGLFVEDNAVQEGMGAIVDRSQEHLGRADQAIIDARQLYLRAAEALVKDGIEPPGVEAAETYEHITDSDPHGSKTAHTGHIVGMFKITSHFDIRRSPNPQTREASNLIPETPTDRPWTERDETRLLRHPNLLTRDPTSATNATLSRSNRLITIRLLGERPR